VNLFSFGCNFFIPMHLIVNEDESCILGFQDSGYPNTTSDLELAVPICAGQTFGAVNNLGGGCLDVY